MTDFVVGVAGAIVGAVIGAITVFLAEIWKQALEGKAAALLVRVETQQNGVACGEAASKGMFYGLLSDGEWKAHGPKLVPLLTKEWAEQIAIAYYGVLFSQGLINAVDAGGKLSVTDKRNLALHDKDFRRVTICMLQIERKSRSRIFWELTIGKSKLPTSEQIDQAMIGGPSSSTAKFSRP